MNDLPEEVVEDSAVLGLQFAGLYGQVIGVDLLEKGLYFGFEGPAFRFPSQLCDISPLEQALEENIVRKVEALRRREEATNPFHEIFHKSENKSKPCHRKIDFIRPTYFTPKKISVTNEINSLQDLEDI
ncbi:9723_t:CDS:2, partial [Ambispora leptoticha]